MRLTDVHSALSGLRCFHVDVDEVISIIVDNSPSVKHDLTHGHQQQVIATQFRDFNGKPSY